MGRAPAGFGSRWETVRGLRLHALESVAGPGEPAVLLPGLVTASRSMVPLARALAARGVRARILDPPGFGYSDKPQRALSVREQADLAAEWLTVMGCQRAPLLGNSFGTQVAAAIAAGHPGAVGQLVLLSPTVSPQIRRWLSWLRALPGPRRTCLRPSGRWRARFLAGLHGRDAPLLAQFPGRLEPAMDELMRQVERLPKPAVQEVYRRSGWLDAISAKRLRQLRSEQLAAWVVGHYPRRRYPVVFVGSSNGAVAHLAAALGAPWLPQTLLLAVRTGGLDPDDPAADMRAMMPVGRALLENNPGLARHHMHDPVQDRLMVARMAYFRVKFLQLPRAYRAFLADCLAPGGAVVLIDCALRWPTTTVGDRHVFQFGALGGATAREFHAGSARIAEFLRRQGSDRDRWLPPAADGDSPEAEWGLAAPLAEDLATVTAERGLAFHRLRFEQPEDASPLIAELFRDWYAGHARPTGRLLVSSFVLMDPALAMRTGLVPYWALFGTQPSLDRLAGYLARTHGYDDIWLTVFPHGVESIGLPGIGQWQAVLRNARQHGQLIAVEPGHYPRHFRALTGFHREMNRLPRVPALPPLGWETARQYLATHAAAQNVAFHEDYAAR